MDSQAYELKSFYNSRVGRVVRRVLRNSIRNFWSDVSGLRVAGFGYATPYLRSFMEEGGAERVISLMPAGQGAHKWPNNNGEKNSVCLYEETAIPLESNSLDRIIMVHSLEFSEFPEVNLQEIWRVLKSSGRLLVIVPNRAGLWARVDLYPLGQGTPYSARQIIRCLNDNGFIHERTGEALFMPPNAMFLKSAGFYEDLGKTFLPFVAGVHLVEVSKQLYAKADPNGGSGVLVGGRAFFPRPISRKTHSD